MARAFARSLGATWAGAGDERPPEELDAAIIFASAGELVPAALRTLAPGGAVVCAGIHMTDIPSFPYEDLWHERTIRRWPTSRERTATSSWPWPTRRGSHTTVTTYPLDEAERALSDLRDGRLHRHRRARPLSRPIPGQGGPHGRDCGRLHQLMF